MCVVKEDNESSKMSNEAYACFKNVKLEEIIHPFFNGVWQGRHVLNEKSPILSPHARRVIKRNGGNWPGQWNNPEDIRKHIMFSSLVRSSLLVSFQSSFLLLFREMLTLLPNSNHRL